MLHSVIYKDIEDVIQRVPELKSLEGKTVLITGAGGLLASYLVYTIVILNDEFFKIPCHLIAIIKSPCKNYTRLQAIKNHQNIEFIESDVNTLTNLKEGTIDYIIHAASQASPVKYINDPINTAKSNSVGLIKLLEIAQKHETKGFLFFSSGQIYGSPPETNIPTPETYIGQIDPLDIRACYDESKRFGETLCNLYYREHGIPVKIVRPFQVYGPGICSTDSRAFSEFSFNAAKGESIILRSNGNARRTFCYISDGTVAFWQVLFKGKPAEAYNVGCSKPLISIKNLAEKISCLTSPRVSVISKINEKDTEMKGAPSITCPDIKKITHLIGEKPLISLEEGYGRVINWLKEEGLDKL